MIFKLIHSGSHIKYNRYLVFLVHISEKIKFKHAPTTPFFTYFFTEKKNVNKNIDLIVFVSTNRKLWFMSNGWVIHFILNRQLTIVKLSLICVNLFLNTNKYKQTSSLWLWLWNKTVKSCIEKNNIENIGLLGYFLWKINTKVKLSTSPLASFLGDACAMRSS